MLHNHHIQHTTFLPNTRNTNKEETQSHAYKPKNTYYINTRPGRKPKKYIDRRDPTTHNYYTQAKYKKVNCV
jgi:hypothetical protein